MRVLTKTFIILLVLSYGLFAQTYFGNYDSYELQKNSLTIKAGESSVKFIYYAPRILRIDFLPTADTKIDTSFSVIRKYPELSKFHLDDKDSLLQVSIDDIIIYCNKFPLRFSFYNSQGEELLSEPEAGGFSFEKEKRSVRFRMDSQDHFYGTGERGTDLDKRGQKLECYNTQIGGYDTPLSTMNLNVNFVCTTNSYALYFDNTYNCILDFGSTDTTIFSFTATDGEISMYLISASTVPEQIERFTWLTGRQPLPPRWVFGFLQSKNRYTSETELRAIVDTLREKKIPCDGVVIDLAWFKYMGDISWDESSWPGHEKMVDDFLDRGIRTILITEPYITERSKNFNTAYEKGYLAKDSTGKPYLLENWWSCKGCKASLLDITNPDAAKWWWSHHPKAFGDNVAGIWTDLGEPERHPDGMKHFLGSTAKVHNIYNLLWAKIIFEGFSSLHPERRVVNLTRSGFAGIQRYGALPWSGDVARNFGGLAVQPPMLLNMGMSGLAYHNSDIGGYSRIPGSPELYSRWMAYGIFCAITRVHGAGEVVKGYPTEPWGYGTETERIAVSYLRLRYTLLPYIYTLAYQNYLTGMPFARPLFFLDPDDKKLLNESSSFLFGDAFLVSPVVKAGITEKEIYFPEGSWINFWTDEIVNGKNTIKVTAPLNQVPLFVREGSIIPTAPLMNFTDELLLDTLIVHVYPSADSTSFTMFEDDGISLEYQKGAFAKTGFTQVLSDINGDKTLHLRITKTDGTFEGQLNERIYLFQVHLIDRKPVSVVANGKELVVNESLQELRRTENGHYFDPLKQIFYVQVKNLREETKLITIIL